MDYTQVYANQVINQYITENITASMILAAAMMGLNCIDGPEKIAVHEIPEEINGQKVVGIGENFLSKDETVVTVKMPSTLRYINEKAFYSCTEMKNVEIPASVEVISDTAFANCPGFTIYTSKGCYAETYTIEKGYSYVN